MDFHRESIDFIKTYENIRKTLKHSGPICRKSFGAPVIRMADAVITTYFDKESVKGLKKCLEYEIRQIRWRDSVWIIPLSEHRPFCNIYSQGTPEVSLLADSIILTIIAYRIQLNEKHTGLSHIVFNEAIQGFEWVCGWVSRGVKIRPSENELIATFDIEHLMKFIPERSV